MKENNMGKNNFFFRHKAVITNIIISCVVSIAATCGIFAAIFFGYFHVSPQDVVDIQVVPADITGTKDDGSPIIGFIIEKGSQQYLVTDYWTPIQMTNEEPSE